MFVWLPRFNYEPLYVVIALNNIQYFTKSVGKRSLFKKIKILYGFYLQLSLVWELSPVDTLYLQSCLSLSVSVGLKNSASFWLLKRKRGVKKCSNENENICISPEKQNVGINMVWYITIGTLHSPGWVIYELFSSRKTDLIIIQVWAQANKHQKVLSIRTEIVWNAWELVSSVNNVLSFESGPETVCKTGCTLWNGLFKGLEIY